MNIILVYLYISESNIHKNEGRKAGMRDGRWNEEEGWEEVKKGQKRREANDYWWVCDENWIEYKWALSPMLLLQHNSSCIFFSVFTTKYYISPFKISIILPPLRLWFWKGFTLILDYVCHLDLQFICGSKHSVECTVCPVIAIFQGALCSIMIS